MMRAWGMREAQVALVVAGLVFQASPIAWAQLATADPVLDISVNAALSKTRR